MSWPAARLASSVFLFGLAGACSEGASSGTFGGPFPPGPSPTATATTGRPATGTDGQDAGECCVASNAPGCNDVEVESCVCAEVTSCCSDRWTPTCAGLVDELGCGQCGGVDGTGDEDPGDSGGSNQDCCAGGPQGGCNDATVQACVCAEFDFCCDAAWDKVCASAVEALGCGHCGGIGDTGDSTTGGGGGDTGDPPPPPPPGNDCCTPAANPGCTDAGIESCVCMQDPFCCDTEWDQVCVDQVDSFGCGDCGGGMPPPGPACCMAQAGPGCGDPIAELCVCLVDSYCCDTQWDESCALLGDLLMCFSC